MSKNERSLSSWFLTLMIPLVLYACDNGRRAGIAAPPAQNDDGMVPVAEESPMPDARDRYKN